MAVPDTLQIRKILVAVDLSSNSKAAFRTALSYCAVCHAKLVILTVFEYAETQSDIIGGELLLLERSRERLRTSLSMLEKEAAKAQIECEAIFSYGDASSTILEAIKEKTIDLAIVGTGEVRGFERLVFGSIAEAVLRKSPCPVLTVGPRGERDAEAVHSDRPIVVALDFHDPSSRILSCAQTFCNLTHSTMHCIHVLPRAEEGISKTPIIPQILTEALHRLVREDGLEIDPVCSIVYGDDLSRAIIDYARDHNAKLLVFGVHKASALTSHFPPHVASGILAGANCPVLTTTFSTDSESALVGV